MGANPNSIEADLIQQLKDQIDANGSTTNQLASAAVGAATRVNALLSQIGSNPGNAQKLADLVTEAKNENDSLIASLNAIQGLAPAAPPADPVVP